MELSIESSCRVCLVECEGLIDIFDEHDGRPISDSIREIAGVKIEAEDGLSKKICTECFEKALDCLAFRQLCIDSDETVRYNLLLDDACDSQSGSQDTIAEEQEYFIEDDSVQQEAETGIIQEYTQQQQLEFNEIFINESNDGDLSEQIEHETIKIERVEKRPRAVPSTALISDEEEIKKMQEAHIAKEQEKKYSCEHCDKKFKYPSKVVRHTKAVHTNSDNKPKKEIKKKHLCPVCGKAFVSDFKVKRHFVVHDTELRKGLQKSWNRNFLSCELCEKTFHNQASLDRHKLICDLMRESVIQRPEGYEYICCVCTRMFPTHEEMSACLRDHKDQTCAICSEIAIQDIIKHGRNHVENAAYKCCVCNKLYPPGEEINIHLLRHQEYRPFSCDECGKSFYEKYKLKQHLKTHDPNAIKSFICTFCEKAFAAADYLSCHIRRKHSDAKPYPCTLCQKSFAFLHDLKLHASLHNGDGKHICHICDASFARSWSLKKHIEHHENNPTDLRCDVCDFIAPSRSRLATHIASHESESPEDTLDDGQFQFMETVDVNEDSYSLEEMQSSY